MSKPSWDDAPEWAMWIAQDASGSWLWWEEIPIEGESAWEDDLHDGAIAFAGLSDVIGDWRETLEERP